MNTNPTNPIALIALIAPGTRGQSQGKARIPKLTNKAIIEAFFGSGAEPYSYVVTQGQFDDEDIEGPGKYYGVEVDQDLAKKWDNGIKECKAAQVETRSKVGLTIRLKAMGRSDADAESLASTLATQLAEARVAPLLAAWEREIGGKTIIPCSRVPGVLLVREGGQAQQAYIQAVAARATLDCGWLWMAEDWQYDDEFLRILRAYWQPADEDDATLIERHKHSGVSHHGVRVLRRDYLDRALAAGEPIKECDLRFHLAEVV